MVLSSIDKQEEEDCIEECEWDYEDCLGYSYYYEEVVSCYGFSDGKIRVTIDGGQAPFVYLWNTGVTSDTLTNLAEGTYYVTVTDSLNCTGDTSIIVTQPDRLIITNISVTDVRC